MLCSSAHHIAFSSVPPKTINNKNKSLERELVLGALSFNGIYSYTYIHLSPAQSYLFLLIHYITFEVLRLTSKKIHPLKSHVFPLKWSSGGWWALITSREFKTQASASESEISLAIQSTQPGTAWRKTPHNEFSEAESLPTAESNIPPVDLLTLLKAT